jgi:enoyl-CoA hydratase/carnithine racemase
MQDRGGTEVLYEERNRVAWITLNRPESMNALNPPLAAELASCIDRANANDDILVLMLMGAGGRAFCAGMDLKWRSQEDSTDANGAGGPGIGPAFDSVGNCAKPIVAAIEGYCLAGGMQIASLCDMRIATQSSKFGMPEARRALAPVGRADTPEQFFPPGEAAWILMTGNHMTAERAFTLGWLQQVVEGGHDELLAAAERLAADIKLCAPVTVRSIKEVLRLQSNLPTPAAGVRKLEHVARLMQPAISRNNESEDRLEGPKAFAEKREPVWKNR